VVNEVVRAWDYDEGAFRALAAAWLELNRAAVNRSLSTVGSRLETSREEPMEAHVTSQSQSFRLVEKMEQASIHHGQEIRADLPNVRVLAHAGGEEGQVLSNGDLRLVVDDQTRVVPVASVVGAAVV